MTTAELPDPPITFEEHLEPFDDSLTKDQADILIASAWARAVVIAPCLRDGFDDIDPALQATVREVLADAVLRRAERGAGAVVQRQAGEYGETIRAAGSTLFRPSEIRDLQNVCSEITRKPRATTIPTGLLGPTGPQHAPSCSVWFQNTGTLSPVGSSAVRVCTCGADLTGAGPLYGA